MNEKTTETKEKTKKDKTIGVRIDGPLLEKVEAAREKEGIDSLSNFIRILIKRQLW
jgi:predicted DNA binding CopG/RHH family protein